MSRIFVSNLLRDKATLIIGGVTISYGQTGVTVPSTESITKIEVRPSDPASLMKILPVVSGVKFENEVTYEARRSDNSDDVLLVPSSPDTIRFSES